MIIIILLAVILLLVCWLVFMHFNHIKTLTKLDSMLDAAIANRFCETEFSETELSKIEAKMFRYLSAGKTSTAQSGRYENGTEILNTWFAGVYPYDNPEYAIVVMTENGKSGAGDCCPIFRAIVEKL